MKINLFMNDAWKLPLSSGYDTQRLRVRPIAPSDQHIMQSLLGQNILYEFIPEIRDYRDALDWFKTVHKKSAYLFHHVNSTELDTPIGFLMFNRDPDKRIYIGGCISPPLWNQGIASELLIGLTAHLNGIQYKHPIYARVHPANSPVRRALRHAGFKSSDETETDGMMEFFFHLP